jgi:ribosome-binding factor A
MKTNRLKRVNSLLREVLFDVIHKEVKNPHVNLFVSVSRVDTSADLHHAKVFVSLIGTPEEKERVLEGLRSAAGFIAVAASKKVDLRHFPTLTFYIDHTADDQIKIDRILQNLRTYKPPSSTSDEPS